VIAPQGITIRSTWLGLPISRHHEPLDAIRHIWLRITRPELHLTTIMIC
jgi:hypothetical protein